MEEDGTDRVGFRKRLRQGPAVLLDGATGSELQRRGVDTGLPLWSARALLEAPDVLLAIHREYVVAGAEVLTANTFRTGRRSLERGGQAGRAAELTRQAVRLCRQAAADGGMIGRGRAAGRADAGEGLRPAPRRAAVGRRPGTVPDGEAAGPPQAPRSRVLVAGSMAPLEDCYRPDLVPDAPALLDEHTASAACLAAAGVDLILVETMNTAREAQAAAAAAVATGLPVAVGFVCDRRGRLLSGEAVGPAARQAEELGVDAVMVNCTPAPDLHRALREMVDAVSVPCGAYGNVGHADAGSGWVNTDAVAPAAYARYARRWLDLGCRLIGGCCGTTPAHVESLRGLVEADGPP